MGVDGGVQTVIPTGAEIPHLKKERTRVIKNKKGGGSRCCDPLLFLFTP